MFNPRISFKSFVFNALAFPETFLVGFCSESAKYLISTYGYFKSLKFPENM